MIRRLAHAKKTSQTATPIQEPMTSVAPMRSITARSGSHIPLKRLGLRHVAPTAADSVE